jgi:WhiB family redox-sensing transcriptional regulator
VKAFTKAKIATHELLVFDGVPTRRSHPHSDTATQKEYAAMDWRHRSACLDEDPELFFPIGNTGPAILQIEEAKQVCRRCDVREQCLAWALEAGQDHGVWGGMSEDERRALKRRNARAKVRTA